ncbi:MAG: NAD(P)H-dependent oxidoreductase subunit E [Chloroflexi bacterium]|nr:NAD(P)H-dependent oxidoreductase subunit E [Chloroflexota bacterium]
MPGDTVTATSDSLRETIAGALANQKAKTVTVLSSLLAIEDELGYIPPQAIEEVATHTHSTINDVWGVASFYTNFRFTPPGEHVVEVCWGPTCHLLGTRNILQAVLDALGLAEEGDTADKKVSLKYNTCLGACSQGPVIHVDGRMLGPQALGALRGDALVQRVAGMVVQIKNGSA